jgi:N-acetylmuramoyl-L-alanine amidase
MEKIVKTAKCLLSMTLVATLMTCEANAESLVAIDVGHSIQHPGAISARGKPEFEFNLGLARILQETFTANHVRSVLIGDDGRMVDLPKRTSAAEAAGATFFLSIHHDSAQVRYLETWRRKGLERRFSDRFSGYSLFVSRKNAHPDVSLKCARTIGSALIQKGQSPSPHHAENIPGESREWADQSAGVYYFDDLIVLKTTKTPAVLIEAGVIINRIEEQLIQNPSERRALATAIVRGLSDCGAIK